MDTNELIARGLARYYRGRLIPIMRGGDENADLFPVPPEDFATLSDEDLQTFIDATADQLLDVSTEPASFTTDEIDAAALMQLAREAGESLSEARAALAKRKADAEGDEEGDEGEGDEGEDAGEGEAAETASTEDIDAEFAALAELAQSEPEAETPVEPEAPAVTAAAAEPEPMKQTQLRRPPRPGSQRQMTERAAEQKVALTAAAGTPGMSQGESFPTMEAISNAMIASRRNFGIIPEGERGQKIPIVKASWDDLYPVERTLGEDPFTNMDLINAAVGQPVIQGEFRKRKEGALVASGGLCAPVTPYYQLQMISVAERPVRAALPSFNADRGGMRFARPASLSAVTTGVGVRTVTEDAAGGTEAQKTCQVIPCPGVQPSRTSRSCTTACSSATWGRARALELVTQWNNLVLAAHARLAESELLTAIDTASTQVTAGDLGLGASSALFGQILTAVNGLRSRHRTDPNAIMRVLLPFWSVDLIVDDIIRGQFQRFDTDEQRVTALLRQFGVEPSFYIDGPAGASQVYGTQNAGGLLPFPSTVNWFIYPEGSFIYLDGGTLELGIVRDSVLNKTNDFQIFGETFESVAFVGVEALSVTSTTCDSGTVAAPHATTCPITY